MTNQEHTMHAENCFPDWTAPEGFDLPEGWKDDSWHNDAFPKFVSPCGFYFLWVDYETTDDREWGSDLERFLIVKVKEPFDIGTNDEEQVLLSNSFDDVRQFINQI
jgi:hypothetical protein